MQLSVLHFIPGGTAAAPAVEEKLTHSEVHLADMERKPTSIDSLRKLHSMSSSTELVHPPTFFLVPLLVTQRVLAAHIIRQQ